MSDVIWELDWSNSEAVRAHFQAQAAEPSDGEGPATAGGVPDEGDSGLEGEEFGGVGLVMPRPASSTNRQVANRQSVADDGGEDTADWGWLVSIPETKLAELRETLSRAQKAAQADDVQGAQVVVGALPFLVRPGGARVGVMYFPWVLATNGWTLSLMDREKPIGETPNVRIHVGSMVLMAFGLEEVYRMARGVVESMGGEIIGEKLSRIDPCLDVLGVPVTEFVQPFASGQVVRRGKKCGVFWDGSDPTGLTVGRGAVMLRIYDKLAECEQSGPKFDVLLQMRYGGEIPAAATRVEFQLRRKVLKELSIETVSDWIAKRASVLDYLTAHWFRLTSEEVDRENTQRAGPSSLWQRVCEGFSSWAGVALLPAVRDRVKRQVLEVGGLMRQAFGCVTSAAAVRGRLVSSWGDMVRFLMDQVEAFEEEHTKPLVERYKVKRALLEAALCLGGGLA